jgi:hypothetical protein
VLTGGFVAVKGFAERRFLRVVSCLLFEVMCLDVKLVVDGEEVMLNEFVTKILGGTVVGAVTSLRGVNKDCKEIQIKISR